MVEIKGDKRVADIYFGEFMRIFAHYRFREFIAIHLAQDGTLGNWKPSDRSTSPANGCRSTSRKAANTRCRRVYFASA